MVEQPQAIENKNSKEHQDRKKERIKATFSLLDRFIKVYNDTETYVKRAVTLFGIGSILAGASFSLGQRLPNNEVTIPQNSSDRLTSDSIPQQPVNSTSQPSHPQPQIIYVTPPTQSITIPHSELIKTSTSIESTPKPVVDSPPATPKINPIKSSPKPVVESPPSTPETHPIEPSPEPVAKSTPPDPLPIPEELLEVKQTVDSVQQISGAIADIKQDLNPLFGGGDD